MAAIILVITVAALILLAFHNYRRGFRSWTAMGHGLHGLFEGNTDRKESVKGNSSSLVCSCPDFIRYRAGYGPDDPRRLCGHLVRKMYESDSLPKEFTIYREELNEIAEKGMKGFYPYSHRACALIQGRKVAMFADDYDENARTYETLIFFDGKRYTHEPETGRWGKSGAPEHKEETEQWVRDTVMRFQPVPLPECSIRTIYRDEGKTAYHLRGEVSVDGEDKRVRASMKHDSDVFIVFCGPTDDDRSSLEYHVLTGECLVAPRIHYMERAIKKWLEDEYPNPRDDYLWGGF